MYSPWVLTVTGLMRCTTCGGRRSWARSTRRHTRKRRARSRGGGLAMTFEELLDQAIALLQRRGRVTYRTLKRQFQLDDDVLEDLKEELIYGQRLAMDEDGRVLVLKAGVSAPPESIVSPPPQEEPHAAPSAPAASPSAQAYTSDAE